MKPSLSIIFFTVSSGAGLGLLALLALGDLLTHALETALILLALVGLFYFVRAALSHEPIRG